MWPQRSAPYKINKWWGGGVQKSFSRTDPKTYCRKCMGTKDVYNHAKKEEIVNKNTHCYINNTDAYKNLFKINVLDFTSFSQDSGLFFLVFFSSDMLAAPILL